MLLIYKHNYLTSVLIYKFLTLDTYLYLREQECEDPWLLFKA
jgi:hypothetical protein